jgi:hypothetical protein
MSCFILLYKLISCIVLTLLLIITSRSVVLLLHVVQLLPLLHTWLLRVFLICMFLCLYIIYITDYFNIPLGFFLPCKDLLSRSQWPRGLRRRSTAARLLRSWVRIPPEALMFVCCECCVLSGRGLCDELITRPEESYRLWCVVVCDLEEQTSWIRRPRTTRGLSRQEKKKDLLNMHKWR